VFDDPAELPSLVDGLLRDTVRFEALRRACIRRLAYHTYSERLRNAVATTFSIADAAGDAPIERVPLVTRSAPPPPRIHRTPEPVPLPEPLCASWELAPGVQFTSASDSFALSMPSNHRAGGERGLTSRQSFSAVELACDIYREPGATLVLKVRAQDQWNTFANSYHLIATDTRGFVARHNHVLANVPLPAGVWTTLRFSVSAGKLTLHLDGAEAATLTDPLLAHGHCFVGLQGGTIRIRNLVLRELKLPNVPEAAPPFSGPPFRILLNSSLSQPPLVTIITPVFDRVECLDRCIRSVQNLELRDYEHIVVADAPPPPLLQRLHDTVGMRNSDDGRLSFSTLVRRFNNWGIAPAWAGLSQARGRYVAFLSDDNGYMPQHFGALLENLEKNRELGFVYSSCLYDGRKVLRTSPPRAGAIDLGQPLFRRELFTHLLNGRLPFNEYMWDWRMIEHFLRRGVRWQHVDQETFIFRLARYPACVPDG
ncbi:MAG: glycosyltransferase, partial [Bryobacterales bacterium]|nr:glycosyltransferase [Bryobacterales bacterium]